MRLLLRPLFWLLLALAPPLLAQAAGAQDARSGETWRVTGVSQDDVLNIRQGPSAQTRKVGEFGPNDSGIVIYDRRGDWARVGRSTPGRPDGWVHTRHLAPVRASARVRLPLRCIGTEPFWGLAIRSEQAATFTQPGAADARLAVSRVRYEGRNASMRIGSGGRADVTAMRCSDGMSDDVFPYSILLRLTDGRRFEGCCR
jgi:hypothetical protein